MCSWNQLGVLPWSEPTHPGFPDGDLLSAQPLKEQPVWENGGVRTEPEKGQGLTGQLSLLQNPHPPSFAPIWGSLSVAGKKKNPKVATGHFVSQSFYRSI